MVNLKDTALNYEAPKLKSVADLEFISVDMEVQNEDDCEFPYKYVQVDGQRYKISNSVIGDMKEILKVSPGITKFKVIKKGEGIKVKYSLIPLQ